MSPMEESLLLPEHLNGTLKLIGQRLGLKFPVNSWKVINGYLYMTGDYRRLWLQPAIALLPIKFLQELKPARLRWMHEVLPSYQNQIRSIRQKNINQFSNKELIELLNRAVKIEGKLMAESVYVVLFALLAELLLKFAYGALIKDNQKWHYQELLVGFPDLGIEGDMKLWEVAHSPAAVVEKKLNEWIEEYGHRIQDKDILYPTLGENQKMLDAILNLYKNSVSPAEKVGAAGEKRRQREIFANNHIKNIPGARRLFNQIKILGQDYAKVRNSRPYYYQGNANIRRILFEVADRIKWMRNKDDVFYFRAEELTTAMAGVGIERLKKLIETRKTFYRQRAEETPPLEVKE